MLPIAVLKSGESCATAEQIRDVPDLAEMPFEVPHWRHADGTPFKIRLRALSFRERTEINRAAKTAKGEDDDDQFALETCLRGMVEPRLNKTQLDIYKEKNAEAIDAISDTIWWLTRLEARAVAAEVRRLADLPPEPPDVPADDEGASQPAS
jgi:hypothetical protein